MGNNITKTNTKHTHTALTQTKKTSTIFGLKLWSSTFVGAIYNSNHTTIRGNKKLKFTFIAPFSSYTLIVMYGAADSFVRYTFIFGVSSLHSKSDTHSTCTPCHPYHWCVHWKYFTTLDIESVLLPVPVIFNVFNDNKNRTILQKNVAPYNNMPGKKRNENRSVWTVHISSHQSRVWIVSQLLSEKKRNETEKIKCLESCIYVLICICFLLLIFFLLPHITCTQYSLLFCSFIRFWHDCHLESEIQYAKVETLIFFSRSISKGKSSRWWSNKGWFGSIEKGLIRINVCNVWRKALWCRKHFKFNICEIYNLITWAKFMSW